MFYIYLLENVKISQINPKESSIKKKITEMENNNLQTRFTKLKAGFERTGKVDKVD